MAVDLEQAIEWASSHRTAVLITLRSDGRAQSSDITFAVVDHTFVISVTDDRAKTHNMRRDPRVVLHITDPSTWSYVSFDGMVDLSPVTDDVADATADALVDYYRRIAGEHDDWDDYRSAMVDQRRLVVRFTPAAAVGQINTPG